MICHACGLEVPSDDAGRLFGWHLDCLKGAEPIDPQRAWADMKEARRANGIDPVNRTELREDGWHNEVTPAVDTMQDQMRYEGEPGVGNSVHRLPVPGEEGGRLNRSQ